MVHNRVISTQATAWLKKTILRRPFVNSFVRITCLAGAAPVKHYAKSRKPIICPEKF